MNSVGQEKLLPFEAIRGVLIDEVHDVVLEEGHVLCESEAQMAQWVNLVPYECFRLQLIDQPLIVCNCSQFVVRANKKCSGNAELVKRDCRRLNCAVYVHVSDHTIVVAKPFFRFLDALGIIDQVSIAVACREIFQEDIVPVHLVDFQVCISNIANQIIAHDADFVAE